MQCHDGLLGLDTSEANDVEGVVPSHEGGLGLDGLLLVLADIAGEGEEPGLSKDQVVVVHLVSQVAHAGLDLVC